MTRFRKPLLLFIVVLAPIVGLGWTELVNNFLGVALTQATPANGQIWKFDSATSKYTLQTDLGGAESLSISDLTDVGAMTETAGDLLTVVGTTWTRLPVGVSGTFLQGGATPTYAAIVAGDVDELLRLEELSDVATMTEAAGDIIARNAGNTAWDRVAIGAAGTFLQGGTSPTYAALVAGDVDELIRLEELLDVATMTEARGDLLVRNAANTAWDKLAVGGATTVLHGGLDPSYSAVVSGDVTDGTLVSADLSAAAGLTSAQILDGELVAGDLSTALANRLNPTPAAAGNIPVDAGVGVAYTSIDGSDADTTKALFATGAAAAPAFRILAAGDIDELITLAQLSDVTGTSGTGTVALLQGSPTITTPTLTDPTVSNTITFTNNAADSGAIRALVANGTELSFGLSVSTRTNLEQVTRKNAASGYAGLDASSKLTAAQGQEVWSISDLTDVGAITETEGDLLTVNGTAWAALARGTANQVLATNSGGTDIAYISLGGDVSSTGGLAALTVTDLTITSEVTGDLLTFNGTNWVRLDATDVDTTKALFSTGAASVPALRNLAAGDIDELLALGQLANVATMTEAVGDVLYVDSIGPVVWQRLAAGTNGQVLKLAAGKPSWATETSGSITVAESDETPLNTAVTKMIFLSPEFLLSSNGAVMTVQMNTDSVTSTTIAASAVGTSEVADNTLAAIDLAPNSVDTSEIVGGAPGAAGAELADTVTNITAATNLQLNPTGTYITRSAGKVDRLGQVAGAPAASALGDLWMDTTAKGLRVNHDCLATAAPVVTILQTSANGTDITGITETAISQTVTPPTGSLNKAGRKVRIRVCGVLDSDASPGTLTMRFRIGSTSLIGTDAITVPTSLTDTGFEFKCEAVVRTEGALGTFVGHVFGLIDNGASFNSSHFMLTGESATVDLTASQAISATFQFSDTGNTLTPKDVTVEIVN